MGALEDFDGSRAEFARLVDSVQLSDLDNATPCSEWNLRQLLNHVISGTQWFTTVILDEPAPDRTVDQVLDDPAAAFRLRADEFRAAISAPGALSASYAHPSGQVDGERYTLMRVNEYLCHGWDLASSIGLSPNFDDELASRCLAMLQAQLEGRPREVGKGFGVPTPGPESGSNYDRLISFAGRDVTA